MDAMGSMRDLDQIREHDAAGHSSRLMSIALGGLATACVLFAVGVMVGREAGDAHPATHDDPLARLDALAHQPAVANNAITFPSRLVGNGAVPAAATPDPSAGTAPGTALTAGAIASRTLEPTAHPVLVHTAVPIAPPSTLRIHDTLSVAGGSTPHAPVAAGTDGPFTVQVGSFRAQTSAQSFAQRLRERGHRAYVSSPATAPNGVMWYRVRVGPFTSQREAGAYRGEFEAHERLPAIVVHRDTNAERE